MAKVALLIGVSDYGLDLEPLPAVKSDVETLRQVLENEAIGDFKIKTLLNPTQAELTEEMEVWVGSHQPDDVMLLFFSGHRIYDEQHHLYLAARNTKKNQYGQLIKATAVSITFVQDCLRQSRAQRQVIVLDWCLDETFANSLDSNASFASLTSQLATEGRTVLLPCRDFCYSVAQKQATYSLYTQYLIEGIKTGAADHNRDGAIAIGELHYYVSRKVTEAAPNIHPFCMVMSESDLYLEISKTNPQDPRVQYRHEVERYVHQGVISPTGRVMLNTYPARVRLSADEAIAIETDVLQPYQDYLNHLQQYRHEVAAVGQEYLLNNEAHCHLERLQRRLGLRDEDVAPIHADMAAKVDAYQRESRFWERLNNLRCYSETFAAIAQHDYPPNDRTKEELKAVQARLALSDEDVSLIEQEVMAERIAHQEAHRHKQQCYEAEFSQAVALGLPMSEFTQSALKKFQQFLGLSDDDVRFIERHVQQRFKDKDLLQIEQRVIAKLQEREDTYQEHLNLYQQNLHLLQEELERLQQQVYQNEMAAPSLTVPHQSIDPAFTASPKSVDPYSTESPASEVITTPPMETILQPPDPPSGPSLVDFPASPPTDLPSEVGIDYTRLQECLQQKQWREADEETLAVMLRATGREKIGWLDQGAIALLPCTDLHTIDRLWASHSNGQFGFSVQRQIYSELEKPDARLFGDRVGWWSTSMRWFIPYNQLTFKPHQKGHLPACWFWKLSPSESIRCWGIGLGRAGCGTDRWMLSTLMARLENWGLQ